MAITVANKNRKMRQEALREQLTAQGHVQHVVDIANKLLELDNKLEQSDIQRLKIAADLKLKLIAKYAPDLKQEDINHTGSIDSDITHKHKVQFVSGK